MGVQNYGTPNLLYTSISADVKIYDPSYLINVWFITWPNPTASHHWYKWMPLIMITIIATINNS